MRVLVVDDDAAVREALDRALRGHGHSAELASAGEEALTKVEDDIYDVIILDVMMPDLDGLAVCRAIRAGGNEVPILMLTAREDVPDRVAGLEAGADDYLVKPFALEELVARLNALQRRTPAKDGVLGFADLSFDTKTLDVFRGERRIDLRRMELQLLELFLRNPRHVLSRSQIYERVWGFDFGPTSNSLDVQLGHLRRKLEEGGEPRLIHTVRGLGYALREPRA